MSIVNELFNISKFNIIEDEEYYYFFRAMNNGDHSDLQNGTITDSNGKIVRIRTDRARYVENPQNDTPKYEEDAPLSLLQVIDHIKEHHRYDTNCISLSSNANVSVMYGNGYYSDEYVLIRVPKRELGERVINAGEYILEEMEKRIEEAISKIISQMPDDSSESSEDTQKILDLIKTIDEATNRSELIETFTSSFELGMLRGREYRSAKNEVRKKRPLRTRISDYTTLEDNQNLLKNKIIAKLTILEEHHLMEPIMPHTQRDSRVIATLGLALSSRELLHYGEISEDMIFEASKEFIHILGLLQQVAEKTPEHLEKIQQMEAEIVGYITKGYWIEEQDGEYTITDGIDERTINLGVDSSEKPSSLSIIEAYELTNGRIDYQSTQESIDKIFLLSKSLLRAKKYVQLLDSLTGQNPEFADVIEAISNIGIGIDPQLMDKKSTSVFKVSESVSIGLERI